jgi:Uma2 family endonuclease
MSQQVTPYISPTEYLRLERQAEYKSEYLNGEIFAMGGANRKHNLITGNIGSELNQQLRRKPAEVYISKMRVKVTATGLYTYPDVVVVCGEPQLEDDYFDTLLNPTVLFEVLSNTTERYDRIAKSGYYRALDSLAEHLLVAQDEILVEHYAKQVDGRWALTKISSMEGTVDLKSIGCSLALGEIYDKVTMN